MCSTLNRYSPSGRLFGIGTVTCAFPLLGQVNPADEMLGPSSKILNHTLPLPSQFAAVFPLGTFAM
jgi:hypothetical protein